MANLKKFSSFFVILFAIIVYILVSAIAAHYYYASKVTPFTYLAGSAIGSTNFSDLEKKTALTLSRLEKKPIVISYNQQQKTYSQSELGIKINSAQTIAQLSPPSSQFGWASFSYWQKFFTVKKLHPSFDLDEQKLNAVLTSNFGENIEAKNSEITFVNDEIFITESSNGDLIDTAEFNKGLKMLLANESSVVTLKRKTSLPIVTTAKALQVKSDIVSKVTTVNLSSDTGEKFTILPSEIYPAIDFSVEKNTYKWSINKSKVEAVVSNKIGKKLIVKVLDRTIDRNTNKLITYGRDGASISVPTIASNIIAAINNKVDTEINPISIPVQKIKFTSKVVDGAYKLGLIDELYVYVNLSKQRMYIIDSDKLIKEFIISSGKGARATPRGTYYIKNKIEFTYSRLYPNIWLRRWHALSKNKDGSGYYGYGVHDLPCMDKECKEIRGASTLGQPASFGCIRVGTENAIWFYDNIPVGTTVYIY